MSLVGADQYSQAPQSVMTQQLDVASQMNKSAKIKSKAFEYSGKALS